MKDAVTIHRQYLAGDFYLAERVQNFLDRIVSEKELNAFVRVDGKEALQQAARIDQLREQGASLGPLAGLVVAVKDNISYRDHLLTCASAILKNYRAPYNATVIEKIIAAHGVIIGQTNMDEFAMGSSSENSVYGAVRNPHDRERVAGGSSGGSAVAVAAGMADLALGSDTGGSIRQPAAFCGIVGLKPSYGRVSRYGLAAYASSLDQIGPFSKTVEDAALALQVISGVDPNDATSVDKPVPDFAAEIQPDSSRSLTFGLPKQFFNEGLDEEIRKSIDRLCGQLSAGGHTIANIDLPLSDYAIGCYYLIAAAEASSNLTRYDGVRYGFRTESEDLHEMYERSRTEGFSTEVKRRIVLGTYVLSSGYYDAYYRKAQQVRRLIKEEYERALQKVDLILAPTTPTCAFRLGEKLDDPLQMYLSDVYTVTANLTGNCAISLPCGKSSEGLPIGVQLIGPAFEEVRLLRGAREIEKIVNSETLSF